MWTTTFIADIENSAVGIVTARYDEFEYSRRVDTSDSKDVESFINEAKEKHSEIETKKQEKVSIADSIASELNK